MSAEIVEYMLGSAAAQMSECTFVDCTLGDGGHAEALLQAGGARLHLVGCDRDPQALERARTRLAGYGERVRFLHTTFAECPARVRACGTMAVDGMLADLGVSSPQLDTAARGFSFQRSGPLDMRMDPTQGRSAADLVQTATEIQLAEWFWGYGEERYARQVARAIVRQRAVQPIATTAALAELVRSVVPRARRTHRGAAALDPATRVFQALRIAVNGELEQLEHLLDEAPALLKPRGRFAILSYHSLEDRLVKHRFRRWAAEAAFTVLTKRPLRATEAERRDNPRARSAKLRVLERAAA